MATGIAKIAEDTDGIKSIHHNKDEVMLRIDVGPGDYLIFGRAVVENRDGDTQTAGGWLTSRDGEKIIDHVEIREIPEHASHVLSLQGALTVGESETDVVDLRCGTHNGYALQPSLIVLKVNQLIRVG